MEGVPNLWKTYSYCNKRPDEAFVQTGRGFGGYPDWLYERFDAKICIREDHREDFKSFEIGTYGLCVKCADPIDEFLYCHECRRRVKCDCCNEYFDEDDLRSVYGENGEALMVCMDCRDANYDYCESCHSYRPNDSMRTVDGERICDNCFEDYFEECVECGDSHRHSDMYFTNCSSDGYEGYVCESCYCDNYGTCEVCDAIVHLDTLETVHNHNGAEIDVCDSCRNYYYRACDRCGEVYPTGDIIAGLCPNCRDNDEEE